MTIQEIYKYLNDNGIYPEDIYTDVDFGNEVLVISISWGDWKHEHWRCDALMSEVGYIKEYVEVTEEDGSDTYSASHAYIKGA